jgi:peptidoglycan/xylan/chitin deacetylase (PgdA/CDA1 family)
MSSRTEARAEGIDVLMYHSISSAPGPTSIPLAVFRAQIEALRAAGYETAPLASLAAWQRGERALAPRTVMITFDDGFQDFADAAFPVLEAAGFTATVFLPTGRLGGFEDWAGADEPPRRLMSWSVVRELAHQGIDFGGHSVTHADLTRLAPDRLRAEVQGSQEEIARQIGKPVETFAPPYGRVNERVRVELVRWANVSAGTRLDRARRGSDLADVPRIEMHYFRDLGRWRAHLAGRARAYLAVRRAGRRLRRWIGLDYGGAAR